MLRDFKISFYVNSPVVVVVQRDDNCGTVVKGNDDGGWSFNDVLLYLERRQNKDVVEWWEESSRLR
jgi:hypothetical protein